MSTSFYEDASLVMIPSGYKTSKVYSAKPTDGAGDLTFTRSNDTATRVGPDGLIEKVRTNLLTYSNDFSNAAWTKTNVTLTSGQVDPNGGSTATNVDPTNTLSAFLRQSISITSGVKYTWSVYIKGSTTGQSIALYTDGASNIYEIKALTTSWQRFTGVATAASSGSSGFYILCGSGYSGLTDLPFDIAFGQVEASDIATDYIATTSAAVSVGPVANVPRLDYLNSSCPRLLLEPQRQNLALFSESFDNAVWTKSFGGTGVAPVVTANSVISPDGYQNAETIVFNAGAGTTTTDQSLINQTIATTTGQSYTFSVYLKGSVGGEKIVIRKPNNDYLSVTLTTEWQRFSVTEAAAAAYVSHFGLRQGISGIGTINSTATIYAYGAQLELGSYASSYVNTLGAAVTRGADACSKTGISSLIGQTEGTIFIEFNSSNVAGSSNSIFGISNGTTSSRALIYLTSNRIDGQVRDAGVTQAGFTGVTMTQNTNYKCAIAYKANDVAFYINGTQIGLDTNATIPAMSDVRFDSGGGATPCDVPVNQALLFKTRLTNAQLLELTSL